MKSPMQDSSAIIEKDGMTQGILELDAEAPGPHIVEIETLEPVREMDSRRHIAEMEGWSRYRATLPGQSNYLAEL